MAGLIDTMRSTKSRAIDGMASAADSETARNRTNDNIEAAAKSEKKKAIGTAAGIGLSAAAKSGMLGSAMATGPAGMMMTGVGLLVSGLF